MSKSMILVVAAGWAATASAGVGQVTLPLDNSSSSISVNATLSTFLGDRSDSDASPLSGTITIELDDYGLPTAISLHDFQMTTDQSLNFTFDYGFLGSVNVDVPSAMANYATPGTPTGPVAVAPDTSFMFPMIETNLSGSGTASGSILGIGSINETIDLAAANPIVSDLSGTVQVSATDVFFSGAIVFSGSSEVATGITMSLDGVITINASGPRPPSCPADWNNDGILDFFDVLGFLDDFSNANPDADMNADGSFDFFDVQIFLQAFSAGCP